MKKYSTYFVLVLFSVSLWSQVKSTEQFPVFPTCEGKFNKELENCFYAEVQQNIFSKYKVPDKILEKDYKGSFFVLFEVNNQGKFILQYANAPFTELNDECKRVFNEMPQIVPPTYGGNPTYARYSIKISIPLKDANSISNVLSENNENLNTVVVDEKSKQLNELDSIRYSKFENPQFKSNLNIPFSHSFYAQFDKEMNQLGANNHTASKPLTYAEVNQYYDLAQANQKLMKNKTGWWGRKLWNEYILEIQGDNYWFTLNPIWDLRVGKSNPSVSDYTYQNTRGIQIQGGIGKEVNFTTSIYESQGRFADYYNNYAESIKPSGGNPAIIPGIGIAKEFKTDSYDFPLADANITYTPSKFFDFQLGYGRNFIGDGYRSLFTSDGASPYPYFKINTKFWKIKYTNTYMWLKDVTPEATVDGTYASKYMANHYLSWNVSNRLNISFFESVVWTDTNGRGFDFSFVNPIIFYRSVEFNSSSKTGNALLGIASKYKWNNHINLYGQFLIDEFSVSDVKAANQSWRNKFGYQIGVKYFNAFKVDNLLFQLEYNHIRPYVYSHSTPITNYGHNNQSLGHQWGGNAKELLAIARYHHGRWFGDLKLTYGVRGLDFDTPENDNNYGGNIYKSYNENRPFDTDVKVGQGNETTIFIADFQAGYLINPTNNLKLFGSLIYRNFDPTQNTLTTFKETTTWFSVGVRADLFNFYFDY